MAANPPSEVPTAEQAPAASQQPNGEQEEAEPAPLPEPKAVTRKDVSLKEFLAKIDDYAPVIPDGVTDYYMTRGGLPPPPQTDRRLARTLALAVQKFIADIAADAYQYSRIRASNTAASNNPMGHLGGAAPGGAAGQAGGAAGAAGGGAGGAGGGAGGNKDANRGPPIGIQRPGFGGGGQGGSQNRTVLTMEDLGMAVGEYGVNVKRSEFYR